MNRYLVELIGTFFLVLTIALTGNPLAIGAVLIAMIYMGGYISGAHYNPAVTLAILIRKGINQKEAINYILFQIIGGTLAAVTYLLITGNYFVPQPADNTNLLPVILLEILFTFALASVVLHSATASATKGNQYFGLAIGLTVMAGAFAAGPISGGVFNPAVVLGPVLVDITNLTTNLNHLVAYLLSTFTGGALAGIFYKYINSSF